MQEPQQEPFLLPNGFAFNPAVVGDNIMAAKCWQMTQAAALFPYRVGFRGPLIFVCTVAHYQCRILHGRVG
jgi:hypothetical protein